MVPCASYMEFSDLVSAYVLACTALVIIGMSCFVVALQGCHVGDIREVGEEIR